MYKIKKTKLKGVYKIQSYKFSDCRGVFVETYNLKMFNKNVRKIKNFPVPDQFAT